VTLAAALVGVLALALGACGGDDGGPPTTEADLARILRDERDLPAEQAECIAAEAYDRLTEDELEVLRERDEDDDLDPALERKLQAAVAPCASAGS
jgi:hypothetical protein